MVGTPRSGSRNLPETIQLSLPGSQSIQLSRSCSMLTLTPLIARVLFAFG